MSQHSLLITSLLNTLYLPPSFNPSCAKGTFSSYKNVDFDRNIRTKMISFFTGCSEIVSYYYFYGKTECLHGTSTFQSRQFSTPKNKLRIFLKFVSKSLKRFVVFTNVKSSTFQLNNIGIA